MRKIICLIVFVAVASLHAQKMSFGVKIGPNLSKFSGQDAGEWKRALGFGAGFFGDIALSTFIHVQPELIYSMQGGVAKDESFRYRMLTNNILLPVMLKYYPVRGFHLDAGPQVGLLVSAYDRVSGAGLVSSNGGSYAVWGKGDVKSNNLFTVAEVAGNVGLGYDFATHWGSSFRFSQSLKSVGKNPSANVNRVYKVYNNVLSLSFEYRF